MFTSSTYLFLPACRHDKPSIIFYTNICLNQICTIVSKIHFNESFMHAKYQLNHSMHSGFDFAKCAKRSIRKANFVARILEIAWEISFKFGK